MEKTGQILDGSAFAENRIALYSMNEKDGAVTDMELSIVRNRENEESVIITFKKYPMMKLRATKPDSDGIFSLLSLDYLAGNTHGWNEYSLSIFGEGTLLIDENVSIQIKEIEQVTITNGRIHRYDTRLTGNEALTALRNRYDRIGALGEWMLSLDNPKNQTIKEFEKHWKPILFPERVSSGKKPSGWKQKGDKFEKAEDIRWNTGYTQRIFPEELWLIRDSGTLLRDWEEALSWIYLEYEWESISKMLLQNNILNKKRT